MSISHIPTLQLKVPQGCIKHTGKKKKQDRLFFSRLLSANNNLNIVVGKLCKIKMLTLSVSQDQPEKYFSVLTILLSSQYLHDSPDTDNVTFIKEIHWQITSSVDNGNYVKSIFIA